MELSRQKSNNEYIPICEFAKRNKIKLSQGQPSSLGKKAAHLCRKRKLKIERGRHPNTQREWWINIYPAFILEEVFREGGFL